MSKGTQLWPGDKMRAFFRSHIRRETELDEDGVERLAEALTRVVNRMLVWDMPAAGQRGGHAAGGLPAIENRRKWGELPVDAEFFNPYLFSVIVVLAKDGPEGLMRRLEAIKSAEDLRAFAEAQHVPVDPALEDIDEIRKAIVVAAGQRLEDRKAAAS